MLGLDIGLVSGLDVGLRLILDLDVGLRYGRRFSVAGCRSVGGVRSGIRV